MYTSFRVKNFRGFRDLQLDDLGRVNLIAGQNNTGKTALLEAIWIHSGNREPKTLLRTELRTDRSVYRISRDFDVDSNSIISWNTMFNDFDPTKTIEMSAKLDRPRLLPLFDELSRTSLKISIKSQDSESFDDVLREFRIEDFELYKDVEILEINSNYSKPGYMLILNGRIRSPRSKPFIQSDFLYTREKVDSRVNALRFSNMRRADNVNVRTLIDALKIIEPRLENLEILYDGNRPLIHANIGLRQLISLSSLGDGMNRIASLILAMGEVAKGVIFIDEIENGLHYRIQKDVWKVIGQIARALDIQVFATTHSLEMIRAAHEAFEDDEPYEFRYHRLDVNSASGDIEAVTYNELDMDAVAAFDFDYEVRG